MKKIIIVLSSILLLSLSATGVMADPLDPVPGDYAGSVIREVQTPATTLLDVLAGNLTIEFLDEDTVLFTPWIDFMGMHITFDSYIGKLTGRSIHTEREDQVMDMSPWGFDAVVTTQRPRGIIVWTSDTSMIQHSSNQNITCEGPDCEAVAVWAAGDPAAEYPSHVSPVTYEFVKMD